MSGTRIAVSAASLPWLAAAFRGLRCMLWLGLPVLAACVESRTAPALICEQPTFAFGEVPAGAEVRHSFVLVNTLDRPLTIEKVKPSCGCLVSEGYERLLAPGATTSIEVRLETKELRDETHKDVYVMTEGGGARLTLTMTGKVIRPVDYSPALGLIWSRLSEVHAPPLTATLTNHTGQPWDLRLADDGMRDSFDLSLVELVPGERSEITVTPTGEFPLGATLEELRLVTGLADAPELRVPLRIFRPHDLEVVPPRLDLRPSPDADHLVSVIVRHNAVEAFRVLSARASDDAIATEVRENEAGDDVVSIRVPRELCSDALEAEVVLLTEGDDKHAEIVVPIRAAVDRKGS